MAKEKYYALEKRDTPGNLPFSICGVSGDVLIAKEEDAQMIVDALNMLREMRRWGDRWALLARKDAA